MTLENAIALSTGIALVTILAGVVGIKAAVDSRKASNYRRTQYLAGFALFSRGFIIFILPHSLRYGINDPGQGRIPTS